MCSSLEQLLGFVNLTELVLNGVAISMDSFSKPSSFRFPSLLRLQLLQLRSEETFRIVNDEAVKDIPIQKWPNSINLDCLAIFKERCPKLRVLAITINASDLSGYSSTGDSRFETLEVFQLHSSFQNFNVSGFSVHKAAMQVSAIMPASCTFRLSEDLEKLIDWNESCEYIKGYREFLARFQESVDNYREIRSDEKNIQTEVGAKVDAEEIVRSPDGQ